LRVRLTELNRQVTLNATSLVTHDKELRALTNASNEAIDESVTYDERLTKMENSVTKMTTTIQYHQQQLLNHTNAMTAAGAGSTSSSSPPSSAAIDALRREIDQKLYDVARARDELQSTMHTEYRNAMNLFASHQSKLNDGLDQMARTESATRQALATRLDPIDKTMVEDLRNQVTHLSGQSSTQGVVVDNLRQLMRQLISTQAHNDMAQRLKETHLQSFISSQVHAILAAWTPSAPTTAAPTMTASAPSTPFTLPITTALSAASPTPIPVVMVTSQPPLSMPPPQSPVVHHITSFPPSSPPTHYITANGVYQPLQQQQQLQQQPRGGGGTPMYGAGSGGTTMSTPAERRERISRLHQVSWCLCSLLPFFDSFAFCEQMHDALTPSNTYSSPAPYSTSGRGSGTYGGSRDDLSNTYAYGSSSVPTSSSRGRDHERSSSNNSNNNGYMPRSRSLERDNNSNNNANTSGHMNSSHHHSSKSDNNASFGYSDLNRSSSYRNPSSTMPSPLRGSGHTDVPPFSPPHVGTTSSHSSPAQGHVHGNDPYAIPIPTPTSPSLLGSSSLSPSRVDERPIQPAPNASFRSLLDMLDTLPSLAASSSTGSVSSLSSSSLTRSSDLSSPLSTRPPAGLPTKKDAHAPFIIATSTTTAMGHASSPNPSATTTTTTTTGGMTGLMTNNKEMVVNEQSQLISSSSLSVATAGASVAAISTPVTVATPTTTTTSPSLPSSIPVVAIPPNGISGDSNSLSNNTEIDPYDVLLPPPPT
jgi:predicted  nucleic acid-binding Zn-ribbon protein